MHENIHVNTMSVHCTYVNFTQTNFESKVQQRSIKMILLNNSRTMEALKRGHLFVVKKNSLKKKNSGKHIINIQFE